jgi:peroxiredoxin
MKKIILLAIVATMMFSCNQLSEGEYLITGTVKGLKSGTLFLQKANDVGMSTSNIDTVKIVDGKFEIKGTTKEPSMHFLQIEKAKGTVPFILEEGKITATLVKDKVEDSKVSGTFNNDEFIKFNDESTKIRKKLEPSIDAFKKANESKMMEAQMKKDTAAFTAIMTEFEAVTKELNDFYLDFPKKHNKAYVSLLLTQSMFSKRNLKLEEVEKVFNDLDPSLKNSKIGKEITSNIKMVKQMKEAKNTPKKAPVVGDVAPDFTAPTIEGKSANLKQSMGKVTLIDFWASWCGPCRAENPNVVALYNELHKSGLNIIGVSLDDDKEDWKNAVAKDKLTWTHVSNLKKWSEPIALTYGVTQIPSTFLLDAQGRIVAKDLRGEELKVKVKELLSKK